MKLNQNQIALINYTAFIICFLSINVNLIYHYRYSIKYYVG